MGKLEKEFQIIACGAGLIPVWCPGCKEIKNALWKFTDDKCDICGQKWEKL